jgi:centrosomal protein CEP19
VAASAGRAGGDSGATAILSTIGDLQRVGPAALQAAKAKMETVFEAKRVKPGDPGYVWDKRVEFTPSEEASDWDD